jgi:fructan beta-fructosidase
MGALAQWRPLYHFTPEKFWTNDPNGLIYLHGVYQLYNQQNPYGNEWGHMSWGHASSTDLVHWKHLPLAMPESVEGPDTTWRYSGCAVFDAHNTCGYCKGGGCIVAIYTADQPNRHRESQYMAYSNDGGMTFTNYGGNPVLDLGLSDFRDPNVSWNAQLGRWLMVVSMVGDHQVRFYTSPDLKVWTLLSSFGPLGFAGGIWECPSFFQLPVEGKPGVRKWVLTLSSPAPHGGPFVQYFIGDFDGKNFVCPSGDVHPFDYGNTFYASIPWSGMRTYLGWIVPEARPTWPWRGCMSIPRDLSIRETTKGYILVQEPAALIRQALPTLSGHREYTLRSVHDSLQLPGNAWWLEGDLRPGTSARVGLRIARNPATGEETVIGYDKILGAVYVDRSHSDTSGLSRDKLFQVIPAVPENGVVHLEILLDKSTLEVFVNHGEAALTTLIFPGKGAGELSAFASGGSAMLEHLRVWNLDNLPDVPEARPNH